jgi:hypothetical protein
MASTATGIVRAVSISRADTTKSIEQTMSATVVVRALAILALLAGAFTTR